MYYHIRCITTLPAQITPYSNSIKLAICDCSPYLNPSVIFPDKSVGQTTRSRWAAVILLTAVFTFYEEESIYVLASNILREDIQFWPIEESLAQFDTCYLDNLVSISLVMAEKTSIHPNQQKLIDRAREFFAEVEDL